MSMPGGSEGACHLATTPTRSTVAPSAGEVITGGLGMSCESLAVPTSFSPSIVSPTVATAGYNAGPSRARTWRADKPLEGAVYTESIPFNETRDYVRKVMSNTMFYSRLIGQEFTGLKERLGVIPPKPPDNE